jgi:hypothetical protein
MDASGLYEPFLKPGPAEMSDNVSTLRNMAASNWAARYEWADELTAAADEIERLRKRLEIDPQHSYDGIDSRDETIKMLEAEIERLRVDAVYGQILDRYIDRLMDPTPDDSLEKVVALMAREVNETMERLRNRDDAH